MKIYLLLLFASLMGMQGIDAFPKRPDDGPDCSECDDGETIPDINSCSQYYLCIGGKAIQKCCARGLYYDAMSGLCNRAFLVDCTINRLGHHIHDIINSMHTIEKKPIEHGHYVHDKINSMHIIEKKPIEHDAAAPCDKNITPTTTPCTTTTTCTTTTKATTSCTTTTTTICSTSKPPKTPCKGPKSSTMTTPCATRTTKSTTPCTSTILTKTPCAKTKSPTTTCTTTTCKPTKSITTTCTTAKPTKAPCSPKTTICTTTKKPCSTITTPCTTKKPPCSTTTVCAKPTNDKNKNKPLQYLSNSKDCLSLPDGTILLDYNHCARYHMCTNKRAQRIRCRPGYWFDQETVTCRLRSLVTNCARGRS